MTPDPKALLPDEVEKALDFLHSYAQFNHRALIHRDNLRAHIAAQAEKIAKLEERLEVAHCYVLDDKTGEMVKHEIAPEERDLMPDGIACRDGTIKLQDKRIAELEADNKRLREALENIRCSGIPKSGNALDGLICCHKIAETTLAQTEQKP